MMAQALNDNIQTGDGHDFVTIRVGEQWFGLPIGRVHDVFVPTAMTRVPMAPPDIVGLLNLRGRVVTALSMRACLGLPVHADDGEAMAVGLEYQGEAFGLLVDEVGEVMQLTDESHEANPVHLDARWAQVTRGIHRLADRLLLVLDIDAALGHSQPGHAA
jgi:purine-binding chemotaxis protein CheW